MSWTVLSVNQNSVTQLTRVLILERAGYQVVSAENANDAVRLFEQGTVDAVVLGNSMSAESRQF